MASETTYDIWVPYGVVHPGDVILENNVITREMKVQRAKGVLEQGDTPSVYIKIKHEYLYLSQEGLDGDDDLIVIQRDKLPEFCRLLRKADNG